MKFFATHKEAKVYLRKVFEKYSYNHAKMHKIYDLKKSHPRRVKTRFMVGTYFDWLKL